MTALLSDLPCEATYSGSQTTANLLRLNFTGLDGGPREMDIHDHLLLAARLDGFTTVDLSDPTHPQILGHYGDVPGKMMDVKFSPDNLTAILASDADIIDLVDIRDPTEPRRAGQWKLADAPALAHGTAYENPHMVFPVRIAGQDWVFLATQGGTGVWILKMDGPPEARTLTYVTTTLPIHGTLLAPHDIYVQFDGDLRQWILYTADTADGWKAFDVSDPANPRLIVAVPNADVSGTHSIQAAKIGDRRIIATSTEGIGTAALKIWDATDLVRPVQIGYWTRQVGPEMALSQHNLNIVEGRLYLAHYANGLFVFDLSQLPNLPTGALELQPEAHYANSQDGQLDVESSGTSQGFWELLVHDGLIYAGVHAGFEEGLHVIGYGCIPAGDARFTSTS